MKSYHPARSSRFALAIALATGAAVFATAAAEPAFAQRTPREERKDKKQKGPAGKYSPAFMAVYGPLNEAQKAATPDAAVLKAGIPGLVAAIQSEDEKNAGGGLIFNIGQKLKDENLQLQGIEMLLSSGKVAPESVGPYNFQAGTIAYRLDQFDKARTLIQTAIDAGYSENNPEVIIAETYFQQDRAKEGLAYLTGAIDARKTAGQPINQAWVKRGLAMAYNAQLDDEANKYALLYVSDFPSQESWGDAVAILLNTAGYQNPEILDLLRLARRTGGMRNDRVYLEYADAADYRRLPAEVVAVIDEGFASGKLPKTNQLATDTRRQAAERAAADRADFGTTLKAARAANAPLRTIMAAGDVSLSLGNAADAEEFYTKAMTQAGTELPVVLTRLGIAQLDQGKYAEAQATFAKVQGARQAIANLWKAYAAQKATPAG